MAELVLTDVDENVINRLRERAARSGRTPEQEAGAILAETVSDKPNPWAAVDAIYNRLAASGVLQPDSVELLREDRDR